MVEAALVRLQAAAQLVAERGHHPGHRGVAAALAQPVHGRVHAAYAGAHGRQGIRHGESVVIVGVEVETHLREALAHPADVFLHLPGVQHAQGVGQHHAPHRLETQALQQGEHVIRRVRHPVRPVLQIEVDRHSAHPGVADDADDVVGVLLRRLLQLLFQVAQGPFGEDVDHLAAGIRDPVHGQAVVHEAQGFHAVQAAGPFGPGADAAESRVLAFRNAGGSHFHAVHLQLLQEELRDRQFLVRVERDAGGLFAVAERGIEELDAISLLSQRLRSYLSAPGDNRYRPGRGSDNTSCRR